MLLSREMTSGLLAQAVSQIGDNLAEGLLFSARLQSDLLPQRAAGSATPTFTRATTAFVTDFEGLLKPVLSGEARFTGARRVYNIVPADPSTWGTNSGTSVVSGIDDPGGGTTAYRITFDEPGNTYRAASIQGLSSANGQVRNTLWIRKVTPAAAILMYDGSTGSGSQNVSAVVHASSGWQRVDTGVRTFTGGGSGFIGLLASGSGGVYDVWHGQSELVTGQSNQNPSEYVSVGVLSAPYHGAGVDGVKYFTTLNGNTVSSNVVTEATGAAITSANAKFGALPNAAGSYFSTPDSVENSVTGDIDIAVLVAFSDWTQSGTLIAKNNSSKSYRFALVSGEPQMLMSSDGTNWDINTSAGAALGFTNGTQRWIRATVDLDSGGGQYAVKFYTSNDGVTWTQFQSTKTGTAIASIYNSTDVLEVGSAGAGTSATFEGRVYRAIVKNGIDGTTVVDFNPNDFASGATWASAATGETWTINGNAKVFGGSGSSSIAAPWDASGPYGYLAEGARTNLCLRSQQLEAAYWPSVNFLTVTADQYVAPDGTTTMDKLTADAGNAQHYVFGPGTGPTVTAAATTTSAYVRYVNNRWLGVKLNDGTNNHWASFDLLNGATGAVTAGVTSTITPTATAGVYRITFTVTTAAGSGHVMFALNDADSATATTWNAAGTEAVGVWGVQVETASFASSYIPTTSASVARNSDNLAFTASGNAQEAEGSAYAEITAFDPTDANMQAMGVATNRQWLRILSATSMSGFDGLNSPAKTGLSSLAANTIRKAAMSWSVSANAFKITSEGASPGSTVYSGDLLAAESSFVIGLHVGASVDGGFGTVRNVRIYNRALSDARLQAMTA